MMQTLRRWVARLVRTSVLPRLLGRPNADFALQPELPLPPGLDEAGVAKLLARGSIVGSNPAEMQTYRETDLRRFLYTWGLVRDRRGAALELGAGPYFTTTLLQRFTSLHLTLANFDGDGLAPLPRHTIVYSAHENEAERTEEVAFDNFNVERDRFPYADATFDIVLFCEIIEHLTGDPLAALLEIRRVLRPGGELVLTTPNVARLENRARLLAGENIYDPYSGYGPYGRHNREYTGAELTQLLTHAGFSVELLFSADVHDNVAYRLVDPAVLRAALAGSRDLGQYLFVRARAAAMPARGRPAWLYRSYAPNQ